MEVFYWSSVLILGSLGMSGPVDGMPHVTVSSFFPEIHRDLSKVTWAHGVNSKEKLKKVLQDKYTMMIEADILMGTVNEGSGEITPIMAHPPQTSSDLSFANFFNDVLDAFKDGARVGVKLDFKDFQAVEPCLKHISSVTPPAPSIPIMINADILPGPVNSTKTPLPAEQFIALCSKYTPYATLSVGWTTRFGFDDPSQEVRQGIYEKQQIKDMIKLIQRNAGDPPRFPHITFPVRAGLAASSIDTILYLTSRIHTSSITLWSAPTDPVNVPQLKSLIDQQNPRNTFIDLPFSLDDKEESIILEAPTSSIQHLSGRGQDDENSSPVSNSSSTVFSHRTLFLLGLGVMLSIFYAHKSRRFF